jgi:cytochrome c553
MNRTFRFIVALGLCTMFHNPVFAADITAGEQKANTCFGCHGSEGNSNNPLVPTLAGQQAAYLSNQITAFRDNKRANPIMPSQVKHLNDNDITDIAAYFASRKTKSAGGNATLAKQGESKASQCSGCHTASFAGRGGFPKLAGQHSAYLAKQLHSFKAGERKSGPMQAISANLSDTDIDQLSAYLGSL